MKGTGSEPCIYFLHVEKDKMFLFTYGRESNQYFDPCFFGLGSIS